MAQIAMGKLLPNLNISIDDDDEHADIAEEGEISADEDVSEVLVENKPVNENVDIVRNWMQTLHTPKIYENKNGGFITGLDLSSEVLMKKLEDRAERFGLQKKDESPITQREIDALYKSLEIDPDNLNSCKLKNIRLDALHMRGVEEMNTNEIFKYFGEYGPASVEWINDFSCNIVWLDEATTARALLGKSQPLVIKKKDSARQDSSDPPSAASENKNERETVIEMSDSDESDEDEDNRRVRDSKSGAAMDVDALDLKLNEDSVEQTSVNIPVPPGHWRVGDPHPKAKALLLRFATKDDKKLRGAEKRSQFYQKYGNPNYGGMVGLISQSRKRKMQAAKNRIVVDQFNDVSNVDDVEKKSEEFSSRPIAKVNRTKIPRMRMYADDEEKKTKISVRVSEFNSKPKPGSIRSRLGAKYTKEDLIHLGRKFSSDSEEEEDNIEINCTVPSRYNIWTDIAKSMAKEDQAQSRTGHSQDLESDLNSYRLSQDLRSSLSSRPAARSLESRDYKTRNLKKSRTSRTNRDRFSGRDLRSTLAPYSRPRNNSSGVPQEDLRSKIRKMKKDDSETRKHRSPLCKDDD